MTPPEKTQALCESRTHVPTRVPDESLGGKIGSFEITSQLAGWSRKRKAARVLLAAGLFMILLIAFHIFFPFHRLDPTDITVGGALLALEGICPFNRANRGYRLFVSDDSITAVYPSFKRSVPKNRVRTLIEVRGNVFTPPTMRVSQHGRVGMWVWGSISIPRALPEYQSLRALALSWRADGFYASRR